MAVRPRYTITAYRYPDNPTAGFLLDAKPTVTRHEASTLDDARKRALWEVGKTQQRKRPVDREVMRAMAQAQSSPEGGNTIGPLPDGTTIVIAPLTEEVDELSQAIPPAYTEHVGGYLARVAFDEDRP